MNIVKTKIKFEKENEEKTLKCFLKMLNDQRTEKNKKVLQLIARCCFQALLSIEP